ncbi:retropepsin-like aspartic protease [Butyricimonas synergistica]|uniref:retropepsin-like aspartic protease n=1 Tax=Butyricimonas synergistica TaxID=544644 RepID=UPI000360ACE7|nr:aspartyl protease family protein [Butyricimonas synergistica]
MKFKQLYISLLVICSAALHLTAKAETPAFYVEVPYTTVNGKIIIEARVEGIPGKFIFDTGAPTYITRSLARRLALQSTGKQAILDAHDQSMTLEKARLKRLSMGVAPGINIEDIPVTIMPEGHLIERFGVVGMVGCDLFPGAVVRIDSRQKKIIITDGIAPFHINPRNRLPLVRVQGQIPFIELNVGAGVIETVMFDSGSGAFYEMIEATAAEALREDAAELLAKGYGSSGIGMAGEASARERSLIRLRELRVSTGRFRNIVTGSVSAPYSRLGSRLLDYGTVTLDYASNAFYFEPFETASRDLHEKKWNVDFTVADGHVVVACVWGDLVGKIFPGERLLKIDGEPVGEVNVADALQSSLVKIKNEKAVITVLRRDGTEVEVAIEKK